MRAYLSLLPILLILVSCSGKAPTKTGFTIDLSGLPVTSTQGGLVIFGKSSDGDNFTRVISTSTGSGLIEEEIPKGTWSFGAVAWDGIKGFTGDITCAFPDAILIKDDTAAVNLTLSNANCVRSDVVVPNTFNAATPKVFAGITANVCAGDVSSQGNVLCLYDSTTRPIVKGFAGSYKMFIPAGRKYGNSTVRLSDEYLESSCYNLNNNGEPVGSPSYTAAELNIPVFQDSVGFPLQVLAYLGSACEDNKGVLPRNLKTPSELRIVNSTPGVTNYLNISASISSACTVSENLSTPNTTSPAAGNGTAQSPWLICTEEQLKAIQENYATILWPTQPRGGVMVLGRAMNLLKFIQTSATDCLREGDTLLPLGKFFSVGYPTCTLSTHTPQPGFRFDGNGNTISYFRYMNTSTSDVGFISTLTGEAYDVKFDRSEVEGGNNTGILAGTLSGGTVKMVTVSNSMIQGNDNTGGIIGLSQGTATKFLLFGENLEVSGDNQTGGLIGHINMNPLTEAYFNGSVYTDSGTQNTGGIVGRTFSDIESAVSMGVVRSGGTKVGGIAGSGNNIKFVRSDVQLQDYSTTTSGLRELGGIVGFQQAATVVSNSLFIGNITSECGDGTCDLGAIVGAGTSAPVDTFSTWTGTADGYNGSATYNLGNVFGSVTNGAICNAAPGCTWVLNPGDKPRISNLETGPRTPLCSLSANVASLATQNSAGRGTAANPFIICNPGQMLDMQNYVGETFHLGDHINLTPFASLELNDFDGVLDGKENLFFGFRDLGATGDSALFDVIRPGSIIRNLQITGTKIRQTGCGVGPCQVGALALRNRGTLNNVHSEDIDVLTSDANVQTGGLVSHNDSEGTINGSHIFGFVSSQQAVGSVAYLNDGTVADSRSDLRIDGQDAPSSTGFFGGIVGVNSGTLSRNRFKGRMYNLSNALKIGGIAGVLNAGSVQRDNEFSKEASIEIKATTSMIGGIAGFSNGAELTRNLSKGTIYGTSFVSDAKSLVGGGTFSSNPTGLNFKKTVAQVKIEPSFGASFTFPGSNVCILIFSQIAGNSDLTGVSGMISVGNEFYHGILDDDGATYTFTTLTRDQTFCSNLVTTVDIYKAMSESAQTLSIATLKGVNYGWDIADMTVAADRSRVFNTYLEFLQSKPTSNKPTWIFDVREEGLSLFGND